MFFSDHVFLAGSGKHGFQMTHLLDCNVYLLNGGSEYALIDAGCGVEPEKIAERIEAAGFPMEKVTKLLLTHIHADHAAGAWYFHDKYALEVVASKEGAPWLEQADMEKTSLNPAKRAGVYPADFEFPACPVHTAVSEGDRVRVGELELNVLETPGHSRGHVSYLLERDGHRSLFAGDVVFGGGKVVLQNIWDCSIQDYAATVAKLSALRIDTLYAGHGAPLMTEAWRHIDLANDHFQRLGIPPGL